MAKKASSAKNKPRAVKRGQSSKVIGSGPRTGWLSSGKLAILVALVFGGIGLYFLTTSNALGPEEVQLADDPARGLLYEGKKVKNKGPCKGGFDITTPEDEQIDGKEKRRCAHLDPTPEGVDIRERIKKVDENLAALAAHDEKYKPVKSTDTDNEQQPLDTAETITGSNMNGVYARDWPCVGTGTDGARVQLIYVYPAGGTNRLSSLRPGFSSIAKRMNQVFFASGHESGNGHQLRYATSSGADGCALRIAAEPIAGSELDNHTYIKFKLRERGYRGTPQTYTDPSSGATYTTYKDRKYMIWIDREVAGKCGLGEIRVDDSAAQTNINNHVVSYSYAWKGCWNYAEPHEVMHMLGGVQPGAPYSTAGYHCRDERDVMCYKDAAGVNMITPCTRAVDFWRFDCRHDTYYRGNSPSTGYLSNHWNTANSRFITR